jgi:Flp pilus assembly protein TadG
MRRVPSQQHDKQWRGWFEALRVGAFRANRQSAQRCLGLLRDRHGVSSLIFAFSALVIMGCVGLGTEVGVWYLVRRETQGAADASAIAGALAANAATANPGSAAQSAVTSLAATNGFNDGATTSLGTVAVASTYFANFSPAPPSTAVCTPTPPRTTCPAVQASISETVVPFISGLFGGTGVTAGAQSVAWVQSLGPACALSLTGELAVQGTVNANSCALASNANDSTAINVTGTLNGLGATTVGGCCGPGTVNLAGPSAPYHPPTPDPYGTANAITFPPFVGGKCVSAPTPNPAGVITLTSYEASGGQAYCSDVDIGAGQTLQFVASGTYIFYNASLNVTAGSIQCQFCTVTGQAIGVNIVFLGTGTLNTANAIVSGNMSAAYNNPTFPALGGILFYGQGTSPASISLASSPAAISGAIYFPNAALTFTMASTSNCLSLVAGTMTLFGTMSLAPSGCSVFNTSLAQIQGVRLVQ